ncbi:DMT family transporter [Blastochloris sulfoviridis]|nr:DMT family transporter [Blastochloris sulfoviridis]
MTDTVRPHVRHSPAPSPAMTPRERSALGYAERRTAVVPPAAAGLRAARPAAAPRPEPARAPARMLRVDNVPRGILYMIAATMFFAVSHAISKWLVATYPVGEVMFLRSLSSLLVTAALVLPFTGLAVFDTPRPGAHLARGFSQACSQTFAVIAFSMMPLAGAIAINFSAPLWAALLSVFWLKERAGPARWAALLTGFSGVVIVANPGADALQIGALFALANAVMYGSVTVAVRGMSATESANTLMMWQLMTVAACHAALLPFGLVTPTPQDALLLFLTGAANSGAQYTWTKALSLAPTAAVSPFYYLLLVWAMGVGFLVWGDVPTLGLVAGSAVVVGSGLFLLWHETRRHKEKN